MMTLMIITPMTNHQFSSSSAMTVIGTHRCCCSRSNDGNKSKTMTTTLFPANADIVMEEEEVVASFAPWYEKPGSRIIITSISLQCIIARPGKMETK